MWMSLSVMAAWCGGALSSGVSSVHVEAGMVGWSRWVVGQLQGLVSAAEAPLEVPAWAMVERVHKGPLARG